MDVPGGLETRAHSPIRTWLFNPFHYIAGGEALAVGAAVLIITALACMASRTHLDGVLDFHPASQVRAPFWLYFVEGLVDWISMSAMMLITGKLISTSHVRAVDVFGTQALARAPYGLLAVVYCVPGVSAATDDVVRNLMAQATGSASSAPISTIDVAVFAVTSMLVMAMLVWLIALMYRAFAVSCNVRGGKAVGVFIVGLLVAEVLSKVVLGVVYHSVGL